MEGRNLICFNSNENDLLINSFQSLKGNIITPKQLYKIRHENKFNSISKGYNYDNLKEEYPSIFEKFKGDYTILSKILNSYKLESE